MTPTRAALVLLLTAALAGCSVLPGASDAATISVEDVETKLKEGGIECTEVSTEEAGAEADISAKAVGCALGEGGGLVVVVAPNADEFGKARAELCSEMTASSDDSELEMAHGSNWMALVVASEGVSTTQLADALGGKVSTAGAFCAG